MLIIWSLVVMQSLVALNVKRFELFNTRHGLSQNSVLSIYTDSKGFLWFGTMNGLNRYDGYNFKIFQTSPGNEGALYNNRVIDLWEDENKFLWLKTREGYVHYFDDEVEKFFTFPRYTESGSEQNSEIISFNQTRKNEIWLTTNKAGVYYLKYDSLNRFYNYKRFHSTGAVPLSNNHTTFVIEDNYENVWIGSHDGLNFIHKTEKDNEIPIVHHFVKDRYIKNAVMVYDDIIWFGTRDHGVISYDYRREEFSTVQLNTLFNADITVLKKLKSGAIAIGTGKGDLVLFFPESNEFYGDILGNSVIKSIIEDGTGNLWIDDGELNIIQFNYEQLAKKRFSLDPENRNLIGEGYTKIFFEDSRGHIWIGTHGFGLAHYKPDLNKFIFYLNNPHDPASISSNFIYSIAEDQSGMLWVGTGQANGGVNKIIFSNPSFLHILPADKYSNYPENNVRASFVDELGNIWLATKNGKLHIFNSRFEKVYTFLFLEAGNKKLHGINIYHFMLDSKGYLWMSSKGGGVFVTTSPLHSYQGNYKLITFNNYRHIPGDENSLSSNEVYCILEDSNKRIWIATYGGGLNLVKSISKDKVLCKRITPENSNLSSDKVRYLYEDSNGSLWIATIFGLNMLEPQVKDDSIYFRNFIYDPDDSNSISYNDIIHIYEDSGQQLWIATFGGGINKVVRSPENKISFHAYNYKNGLANDAVFGILEDGNGKLWLSTENGISKFNTENGTFESFDESHGLMSGSFSENTCFMISDISLLFGTTFGALVIFPSLIPVNDFTPNLVLTNFQLFNHDIDIFDESSPIKKTIQSVNSIVLKHYQSSFSIEYAALDFLEPSRNQYAFMLKNFDSDWNYVQNQRKATYTNLKPGKYIFMVKGSGWNGVMGDNPVELNIEILPPWWKTIAFRVIFIISLISLFTCAYLNKVNKLRKQRLKLEILVEERTQEIANKNLLLTQKAQELSTTNTLLQKRQKKIKEQSEELKAQAEELNRSNEFLQQLNATKDKFFSIIAHDLKNPFTSIIGFTKLLVQNYDKLTHTNRKEYINALHESAEKTYNLLGNLLQWALTQKGDIKFEPAECSLNDIVNSVVELYKNKLQEKDLSLHIEMPENAKVYADEAMINTVLRNLLSNAIKFSEKGKVTISIKINDGFWKIGVIDTGIGMSEELIKTLFDITVPNSSEGTRNEGGTGLGLIICKEFVHKNGGQIFVNSKPGAGSEFYFTLPKK